MPRTTGKKQFFNFVGGLNSEASPVNIPPNTSWDECNFDLHPNGIRTRRLGIDLVSSSTSGYPNPTEDTNVIEWDRPGNDAEAHITCVKAGMALLFYYTSFVDGTSKELLPDVVTLSSYTLDSSTTAVTVEGTSGNGRLFVTGSSIQPLLLEFNTDYKSIKVTPIVVKIRDFIGADDGLKVDEKPAKLTDEHRYNLHNQGWSDAKINDYHTSEGKYPANNQIWWRGKVVAPDTGVEFFNPDQLDTQEFGTTNAPRGSLILNAFTRQTVVSSTSSTTTIDTFADSVDVDILLDTDGNPTPENEITAHIPNHGILPDVKNGTTALVSVSLTGKVFYHRLSGGLTFWYINIDDLPIDVTIVDANTLKWRMGEMGGPGVNSSGANYAIFGCEVKRTQTNTYTSATSVGKDIPARPATIAFYAGRVWYGGVPNTELGTTLFYSQIMEQGKNYDLCYQEGDPTSEYHSQVIATDGGTIVVPDIGRIIKLLPYSSSLLAFADNGVWEIAAGTQGYFTPTNFSVRKLAEVSCLAPQSIKTIEGTPTFWATDGIYILMQDPRSGYLTAENMTKGRLDSFLAKISHADQSAVATTYDSINKRVYWSYRDTISGDQAMLTYDTRIKAFWPYNIDTTYRLYGASAIDKRLIDEGTTVASQWLAINSAGEIGWSSFIRDDYQDWDVADAPAFIETGWDTGGDATVSKIIPVVYVYMLKYQGKVSAASCKMQGRWDWSIGPAGYWGQEQQVYRDRQVAIPDDEGNLPLEKAVMVSRNRLRGTGKSVALRFTTEPSKSCDLVGWAVVYEGATIV